MIHALLTNGQTVYRPGTIEYYDLMGLGQASPLMRDPDGHWAGVRADGYLQFWSDPDCEGPPWQIHFRKIVGLKEDRGEWEWPHIPETAR